VNCRKPRVQTPVVSRYPTPTFVHDCVLLLLPPCGPHLIPFGHRVHRAEPTCLSTPQRPRKAKTFHASSSPAPTQIKPQPTPAILDQESVHTTLSITHHTREQPSTGPRTLRSSRASAKGLCLVGPPRSVETSRFGSRDPVASGVKCGPHGGKKSKTKSWT
jgi:hypothetical protein